MVRSPLLLTRLPGYDLRSAPRGGPVHPQLFAAMPRSYSVVKHGRVTLEKIGPDLGSPMLHLSRARKAS